MNKFWPIGLFASFILGAYFLGYGIMSWNTPGGPGLGGIMVLAEMLLGGALLLFSIVGVWKTYVSPRITKNARQAADRALAIVAVLAAIMATLVFVAAMQNAQ